MKTAESYAALRLRSRFLNRPKSTVLRPRLTRTQSPLIELEESLTAFVKRTLELDGLTLWTPQQGQQRAPWPTQVQFSREYFESLLKHAVPLNESAVGRLSHTAMGLDIYAWLAQRLHRIEPGKEATVSWTSLCEQFGPGYAHVREFRRVFKHTVAQVQVVYPDARFELSDAGMGLKHSRPPVARRLLPIASV